MIRFSLTGVLLLATVALADGPNFSGGGFLFSIQYGPGFWGVDRAKLVNQVGAELADTFITDAQNTHTVSIRAGYNIKGHASISADLTGTGWNLTLPAKGGGGWLTGTVHWHPLELVFMNKEKRPIPFDVSPFFGVGYSIVGQKTGMDGLIFQTGLNADYFFTRYFGLGVFFRAFFLDYDKFYLDYYNRDLPGSTIGLPQHSGGNFFTFGLSLHFRAGD